MSKLPNVGTTIFTVMSKLAGEHDAINLSQGFPNFPVDEKLLSIYGEQLNKDVHQYMPMPGSPALLQQIGALIEKEYGRRVDPSEELLVTAGATQAIFTSIMALVESGDEVIILDPSYDCYAPAVELSGGKPVHVQLSDDFLPDWEHIEHHVNKRTKMLIVNNPHNPSGRAWNMEDIEALEKLLINYPEIILLSDEVYEFITFEKPHISIHTRTQLLNRSVLVSSFGKTFHVTGWKMGYLVAPEKLMKEIKKVHQFNVFSVNSVAQATLTEYLGSVNVGELGAFYQTKRDLFRELMKESRFELLPCEGTYFQTVKYDAISPLSDVEFSKELTTKHGVAAIPISVFNKNQLDNNVIRFCFAKDDETLIAATKKLCAI